MQITTIGVDLAKHWFQVHGVDADGKIVVKRRLCRSEVIEFFKALDRCLVGMEACATAHHWARELMGHEVKLMPPAYVKAYVKRNKNDAADAEAICEAVTRPSMRFVPVKDADQQSVLMMHRARNLLVRQRTMLVNALRAHMAEFGFTAPQGPCHVDRPVAAIEEENSALPELARSILRLIVAQLNDTQAKVRQLEAKLAQWHRNSRVSKLLATIPGVGIMGASAIAATVCDPNLFRSGREFAAWLGMTPRQNSSGGKEQLGRTSKRGDKYIRCLLVAGAVAVLRHARTRATKDAEWVRGMLARKFKWGRTGVAIAGASGLDVRASGLRAESATNVSCIDIWYNSNLRRKGRPRRRRKVPIFLTDEQQTNGQKLGLTRTAGAYT
jgi:transposase